MFETVTDAISDLLESWTGRPYARVGWQRRHILHGSRGT